MRILDKIRSQIEQQDRRFEAHIVSELSRSAPKPEQQKHVSRTHTLNPGYIFVPAQTTIVETLVGSGMSTCLYDSHSRIGGINHFAMPLYESGEQATARYGDISLELLLNMMQRAGAALESLQAQIYGGAYNSYISTRDVGLDNYKAAKIWLHDWKIPITALDVGGRAGRIVRFNSTTGHCRVMVTEALPENRWFPYGDV
jgi:chemotaxis protein CheD